MSNMTNEERIIKAKIQMGLTHPFFAYILMKMNIQPSSNPEFCPTMGVSKYGDLYWNDDFVTKLTDQELRGVMCHESMHMATLTFERQLKRDMGMWNIATDLVINYLIQNEGFILPKDGCTPDRSGNFTFKGTNIHVNVANKTAEQVYEELERKAPKIKVAVSMDEEGNYDGSIDKHIKGDKDADGKEGDRENDPAKQNENEQKWKMAITDAMTRAKMRGNLSDQMERMLEMVMKPIIDWRAKLFAYLTKELPVDYTMRMPSRRFIATQVYTPSVVRENLDVVIGVDISGSISDEEYKSFMAECIGIANAYQQVKMRVVAWACSVDERDDMLITTQTQDQLMKNKFYGGGGGTSLSCFTEYCQKKNYRSRIYVILTDGYIEQSPKVPTDGACLFITSKNGTEEIVKHFGEVCSLNDVIK